MDTIQINNRMNANKKKFVQNSKDKVNKKYVKNVLMDTNQIIMINVNVNQIKFAKNIKIGNVQNVMMDTIQIKILIANPILKIVN